MPRSDLDAVFSALADPSRRSIVTTLARTGEATVGTVAAPLAMTAPSVTKHLKVLERAGLVDREVRGREHWLRLTPGVLDDAAGWIEKTTAFWTESLDRLTALVADLEDRT